MSRFAFLSALGDWWLQRSRRERVMLTWLCVFLFTLVLIFGVIRPLASVRDQAFADIRTYETLSARIRAAGTLTPGQGAVAPVGGTPVEAVTAIATRLGVVAQVEPVGSGARATAADADYAAVMAWIAEVGATQPLRVTRVAIQRRAAPGRVSASVEFAP